MEWARPIRPAQTACQFQAGGQGRHSRHGNQAGGMVGGKSGSGQGILVGVGGHTLGGQELQDPVGLFNLPGVGAKPGIIDGYVGKGTPGIKAEILVVVAGGRAPSKAA